MPNTSNGKSDLVDLSAETSLRLKMKRQQLCISRRELAELLGVDWTTVKKWEQGQARRCLVPNYQFIQEFISGKYDTTLKAPALPSPAQETDVPSRTVRRIFRELDCIATLLKACPETHAGDAELLKRLSDFNKWIAFSRNIGQPLADTGTKN